jgi:uncharacterized protein (TIGR00369 family)
MTTGRDMTLNARDERLFAVPFNRHLGLVFDGREGGVAYAHMVAAPELVAFSVLHGGALYAVFDAMGLLAISQDLADDQHAATHDLHVSMMRTTAPDAVVHLSARAVRRGRTLAFIDAQAEVDGKVVATARITKSIVANR